MNLIRTRVRKSLGLALVLILCAVASAAQQATITLRGQVTDEFGGLVVGATVSVVNQSGVEKTGITNEQGNYVVSGLAPGTYTVRAVASGFALFENAGVQIVAGRREPLDIKLSVTIEEQKVTVSSDQRGISTESENNADALVLRGKDIEALPDDPDDLAAALNALAGPSAGPNGGQIYIDGFTGGRLPPKEAIREVRISQNPLNAENDRPGFGRIDILTRPGFDKIRGSASVTFNDESMNARNPFAPSRADFQQRLYTASLGGPVIAKKSSFFLDFQKREEDDNEIVNAVVLNAALNPVGFNQVVLQPRRNLTFSPRFDYAFNQNHTLVLRYTHSRFSLENSGVGTFSLPSRAYDSENSQHTFQITETAVLNPKVIMETRFQFIRNFNEQNGDNTLATVSVQDAFTGGGSQVGLSFVKENRWELQNYWTATIGGQHVLRFGVRLRGVNIDDVSRQNFGGTYIFGGGEAPRLDGGNNVVIDPATGLPILAPITSLERFRRTIALQQAGFTNVGISARGGGPTQFTLAGGNPLADVSQIDFGGFIQDEWRVRPNMTLTYGVRYETQNNISSRLNFAPRIFFAWAPGGSSTGTIGQFGSGQPKFVVRAGGGMFYDRLSESATLNANRFDGINQQRFNIIGPAALGNAIFEFDGTVTNVPTINTLTGLSLPQVVNRVDPNIQAPYSLLGAINVERQLPGNFTVFGVLFTYRTRHAFVFRDINAPLPGTVTPLNPQGTRPNPAIGNIFQWESSGHINMTQLFFGVRNQINRAFSVFANYGTGKVEGNSDCFFGFSAGCYVSNSYDINSDFGRLAFFPRHNLFIGGNLGIPKLNISLTPFIVARTGRFFNITTGRDSNGDRLFLERPAFASATTRPEDLRVTPYGDFDINPAPGAQLIPRNYGEGPSFISFNLGLSRTFGFGDMPGAKPAMAAAAPAGGGAGGVAIGGPRGGAGGAGGQRGGPARAAGPGGGASAEKRYNLTLSINIQNMFNRSNLNTPVGNLSSPLFGQSVSTLGGFGQGGNPAAGNRRVQASLRFNF